MGLERVERHWLEFVADLMTHPPAALPAERIALALCDTFGLSGCSYNDMVPAEWGALSVFPGDEQFGGLRQELLEWTAVHAPREHPLLRYYQHTGRREPVQTVDVPDRIAGPRGGWADISGAVGADHQLALPLRMTPRQHRAFVLGRTDVFTPQELALGQVLWRLLTGLDQHLEVLGRVCPEPAVAAELHLTPREQAVLGLLSEGLTAAAIGRRLLITERTVHKHLERAYAKLGVRDRLGAVLRAHDLGLLSR